MSSRASGTGWFIFQRASGVMLVILFALHFGLMHFSGGGLDYTAISARLSGNLYRAVDLAFLVLALAHGLFGTWMVAGDYLHRPWLRLMALILCAGAGLGLALLGAITILGG